MKIKIIVAALILSQPLIAQIPTSFGFALSKTFGDDVSLVKAETYFIKEILNSPAEEVQFEFERIASSSSGDLTSFYYICKEKNKEGIILAFYGDYWNKAGDIYKGFLFKSFTKNEAIDFFNKITKALEVRKGFLSSDNDNKVYIQYDDIFIILSKEPETKIKIFWNGIDADLDRWAFSRINRWLGKDLE